MKKLRLAAAVSLVAVVPVIIWTLIRPSYPMQSGTDRPLAGYIVSGEKFGVKIGDHQAESNIILEKSGVEYINQEDCKSISYLVNCKLDSKNSAYSVSRGFYHGKIFLILGKNERVDAIAWEFYIIPHIDF
jgi:hypothetical protein